MPKPLRPAASAQQVASSTVAHEQDADGEASPRKPMVEPAPVSGPEALPPPDRNVELTPQPAAESVKDGSKNDLVQGK
jgi:hypothetical protein